MGGRVQPGDAPANTEFRVVLASTSRSANDITHTSANLTSPLGTHSFVTAPGNEPASFCFYRTIPTLQVLTSDCRISSPVYISIETRITSTLSFRTLARQICARLVLPLAPIDHLVSLGDVAMASGPSRPWKE